MVNRRKQRLDRVETAMRSLPVRSDLLEKAFQEFIETGVLPEEKRLAWAVCQQALNGGKPTPTFADEQSRLVWHIRKAMEAADRGEGTGKEMSVREQVFREAIYAEGPIQIGAQSVLKIRVGYMEQNPCDPQFLADEPLPEHPGVGLFILGFPKRFATAPYEEQAARLFERANDLRRNRIDHDDPKWESTLETAMQLVQDCGEIPEEGLLRDCVLALLEFEGLKWNFQGESVRGLMAALDTAARTAGDEREAAIVQVRELALAGFADPPNLAAPEQPTVVSPS
jgi:hypothetical protein